MGKNAGHGCVHGKAADTAVRDPAQHMLQAVQVHGFVEDVFHHLADEGMIG